MLHLAKKRDSCFSDNPFKCLQKRIDIRIEMADLHFNNRFDKKFKLGCDEILAVKDKKMSIFVPEWSYYIKHPDFDEQIVNLV